LEHEGSYTVNPFEMVVMIVAIGAIASVFRAKYGVIRTGRGRHAVEQFVGRPDPETDQMREEVKLLKDRIAVLERVITDTNSASTLDLEIEKLR
jgi:HAMP domain-containing protein